MKHWSKT